MRKFSPIGLLSLGVFMLASSAPAQTNGGPGIQWQHSYGGVAGDGLDDMLPTGDGGCVLFGTSQSDFRVIRIDAGGSVVWDHFFGGDNIEYNGVLKPTSDGGFLLAGISGSDTSGNKSSPLLGAQDIWLVRLDGTGNRLWEYEYGVTNDDMSLGDVRQTADGGFIFSGCICGYPTGDPPLDDAFVVRLDAVGNKLWDHFYGRAGADFLNKIQPLPDGGFVVAGDSETGRNQNYIITDIYVLRLDANGNRLWEKYFGGTGTDVTGDLLALPDGGFVVAGSSDSGMDGNKTSPNFGGSDFWLLRLDADGAKLWEQTYGGSADEFFSSIRPMPDGGYLLVGQSRSGIGGNKTSPGFGGSDFWIVRVDSNGNKFWDRSFGGTQDDDRPRLQPTADGGFVLAGLSYSGADGNKTCPNYGADDYWLVRLDANGNKLWDASYGGTGCEGFCIFLSSGFVYTGVSVVATPDGFIVGGSSGSPVSGNKTTPLIGGDGDADMWVLKLGPETPPTVALQSVCALTAAGSNSCLVATAAGMPPFAFQWFHQGVAVPHATNATFCLTNAQPLDGGSYYVVVRNSSGVATSQVAQVTVMPQDGPPLVSPAVGSNNLCLTSRTYPGVASFLEYKNDLADTNWVAVAAFVGDGSVHSFCDSALTNSSRFYRLRLASAMESFGAHYLPPEFSSAIGDPAASGCGCSSPGAPSGSAVGGSAQDNAMGNVLLHTGEFTQRAVDLEVPARGFQWRFERAYRSGWNFNGPLGYGWDFNYNRRLYRETNGNVLRLDGLGRADRYVRNGAVFQSPTGIYNILTNKPDGTYEEREPHGTRWLYSVPNCLGVSALVLILDRNSNSMRFNYNAAGQLTNAIDSVGRSYAYQYDATGRLVQVADFTGRAITLGYDGNGDLVSVTSPPVTGTPNGNDFPAGKTTRYTYSFGFPDPRLNHNLLTVTAPNQAGGGPPRISVAYQNDPVSSNLDRVLSVNMGGTLSYAYANLGPAATNDFATAVFQNLVTDRNGNITQYRFNQLGNILRTLRFTRGLRPTDPSAYTNLFEYNKDGELIRRIMPEGDSTEYAYDSANPDRLRQGNLLSGLRLPGPRGGDQSQIGAAMTYEARFNFVATATDAKGGITRYAYDQLGNRTSVIYALSTIVEDFEYNEYGQMTSHTLPDNGSGHRRRDTTTYYTNGPAFGYVRQSIVDAGGFNLTTTYEYDSFGNLVRKIDPRSHDTLYDVNSLNQVVRETSPETTDGSGIRYHRDNYYDANGNIVRTDVQNLDENGVAPPQAYLSTTTDYDLLDNQMASSQQVDAKNKIGTGYAYDGNQNPILTRFGEAVAGNQTNNIVTTVYDERNLAFRTTRGRISTSQRDYDRDGNLLVTREGIEDTNGVRITTYTYDGFNRRKTATDAMGNVTTMYYDANGNVTNTTIFGELADVPGSLNNVRLSERSYSYDAMNRLVGTDTAFFDAQTQAPILGGHATNGTAYSANSQVLSVTDANGHITSTTYDFANRPLTVTDARGNTTSYTYDYNGNVLTTVETDLSDLGNPSQSFTSRRIYDNQDRLIATVDNIGITNRFGYDSRNNRALVTDGRSNKTHYVYDGLNRSIRTVRDMTTTGDGTGAPAGTITTRQQWDADSRLTAQIDDNGHATGYAYDGLNRQTATTMADGSSNAVVLDIHGNIASSTDANGTTVTNSYDLLDRVTNRIIVRGPGVRGSTNESYRYDGLSQLVQAEDDISRIGRDYDSLGRVVRETSNLEPPAFPSAFNNIVTTRYDGVGNQTSCTYPGGQVVTAYYDLRRRKSAILLNGATNTSYAYVGSRVEQRRYTNSSCDYAYDGARRMTAITNRSSAGGVTNIIDARTLGWDASYNKTRRSDVRTGGPQWTHFYTNDSAGRLIGTLVTSLATNFSRTYLLDGVGNRCNIDSDSTNCTYAANAANAYLTTPEGSRAYDGNGNLTAVIGGSGAGDFAYDYRNLMTQALALSNAPAFYVYDVLGRRVQKSVGGDVTRFVYDGWKELEEEDTNGLTVAAYVHGNYIDEVLSMQRGGTNLFYYTDEIYNVVALSDGSGNVLERYEYADYGQPLQPDTIQPIVGNPSALGNPLLFNGQRYDSELGWSYYRTRYHDTLTGRFTARDTIGTWGDPQAFGNAYSYGGCRPQNTTDALGTSVRCVVKTVNIAVLGGFEVSNMQCVDDYGNSGEYTSRCFLYGVGGGVSLEVLFANLDHIDDLEGWGTRDNIGVFVLTLTETKDAKGKVSGQSGGVAAGPLKVGVTGGWCHTEPVKQNRVIKKTKQEAAKAKSKPGMTAEEYNKYMKDNAESIELKRSKFGVKYVDFKGQKGRDFEASVDIRELCEKYLKGGAGGPYETLAPQFGINKPASWNDAFPKLEETLNEVGCRSNPR